MARYVVAEKVIRREPELIRGGILIATPRLDSIWDEQWLSDTLWEENRAHSRRQRAMLTHTGPPRIPINIG